MEYNYATDSIAETCLNLSLQCRTGVGFGAVLVKDGEIIGKGRNRRSSREDRKLLTHIDYAIHAEQDCIADAIRNGHDISGSEVYVIGQALSGKNRGRLTIRYEPIFVCRKCPHTFVRFNIPVNIPYYTGWLKLSPDEAMKIGTQLADKGYWKQFLE